MIHISQDELFEQLEFEHKQLLARRELALSQEQLQQQQQYQHHHQQQLVFDEHLEQEKNDQEAANAVAIKAESPPRDRKSSQAVHDMSSILPKHFASFRDKNNNYLPNGEPDDEAQAVIITGCGSKIGRNIAVAFARMDLKVALVDFDSSQIESVAAECELNSPKKRCPLKIVADISQLDEAHKVIDETIGQFGRLDVLVNTVNNASLMEAKFKASGDDDPHVFEQYHRIIANNMHSVTYLCISAAPYLRKTKGSIVNVSSITNNETGSYKFAYCMSKAGISTLTKCLATDLAPDINVICVSPKGDP